MPLATASLATMADAVAKALAVQASVAVIALDSFRSVHLTNALHHTIPKRAIRPALPIRRMQNATHDPHGSFL